MDRLLRSAPVVLACAVLMAQAQAQNAKADFDKAEVPGTPPCTRLQLYCQAAKEAPGEKKYQQMCSASREAISKNDQHNLEQAQNFLADKAFDKAALYAGRVCQADENFAADARQVIAKAKQPVEQPPPPPQPKVDQSGVFYAQAKSAYDAGDFSAAVNAANQVTDGALKGLAKEIIDNVNRYTAAMAAGQQKEQAGDNAGALESYKAAMAINSRGPGSPASHMAAVEAKLHPPAPVPQANPTSQAPGPQPSPTEVAKGKPGPQMPPKPAEDDNTKIAHLLDDASKAQSANNLAAARRAFDSVLRLQPTNALALAGKADVERKMNSDPQAQAKLLAQAIRDFYGSKYDEAADGLTEYIGFSGTKSRGAAFFYLGATRLYQKVLIAGQKSDAVVASAEVQHFFKDAHAAGYQPVERLVSPVVMRAWRTTQ